MTSASELFYNRRSRLGRNEPDLGFDSSPPYRNLHQSSSRRHHNHNNHNHHHRRHGLDGCDPLRGSPAVRHLCQRASHQDRTPVWPDQGTSNLISSNSNGSEILSSGTSELSSLGNERLPGAVLLARERLLQRLRGVSLSGNRRSGRPSSGSNLRDHLFGEDFQLVDGGDWGAEIASGRSDGASLFPDLSSLRERVQFVQESSQKKPPGLSKEALDALHFEIFSSSEVVTEDKMLKWDCSICLENFIEGDELRRLPCGHRFHSACLDPWAQLCGDCPYCRRGIVLSSTR